MGKRGPKPGFKQARAAQAASAAPAPAKKKAAVPKATAASPMPEAKPPVLAAAPIAPVAKVAPVVTPPAAKTKKAAQPELSASDRENPNKLSGTLLRELAHRRGLAKSSLPDMSDEKIREQLRYMTHRQYDDAVA